MQWQGTEGVLTGGSDKNVMRYLDQSTLHVSLHSLSIKIMMLMVMMTMMMVVVMMRGATLEIKHYFVLDIFKNFLSCISDHG